MSKQPNGGVDAPARILFPFTFFLLPLAHAPAARVQRFVMCVFSLVMAGQSESSSGLQRVAIGLAALPRLW